MTNKLTAAQAALLRSGFLRADHCIVAPAGNFVSIRKSASKMIDSGWLKEIKAKADSPIWRVEGATGATYSLKLTTVGLKVITADDSLDSGTIPLPTVPTAPSGSDAHDNTEEPVPKSEAKEDPPPR